MGDTCEKPAASIITAIIRAVTGGAATASRHLTATQNQSARSGPVLNTGNGQIAVGGRSIDLTARAVRTCNRNRKLTDRYLKLHRALATKNQNKEPYYE